MDTIKETIIFEDLKVHRAVSDDGTEIVGRVIGEGPPLLLLPAGPGDSETSWRHVLPYLSKRFTCYLLNTRNRGLSGKSEDVSPIRLVEDVRDFAKSIGEPAGVVCWGTFISPEILKNGGEIAAVAIYEPLVFGMLGKEEAQNIHEMFARMGELATKGNYSDAANFFLNSFGLYNDEDMADGAPKVFWETAAPNIPVALQELNLMSKEPDTTDPSVLREIKVPFLLLKGSQSHSAFIDSVHHCSEHLANPEVRQIDRAGHFGPYIRPEAVASELVGFFEKVLIKKEYQHTMKTNVSEQINRNSISTEDIQLLLDKDAIKELWYMNCYLIDQGEIDKVMDTFTEDAIMDTGAFGSAQGTEAIRDMLKGLFAKELLFTRHMVHMPLIIIDGDEAVGKWYLDCPSIVGNGEAAWTQGIYKHTFRRVNGEWKIYKFTFEASYVTPYDQGWAKQPFIEEKPEK